MSERIVKKRDSRGWSIVREHSRTVVSSKKEKKQNVAED